MLNEFMSCWTRFSIPRLKGSRNKFGMTVAAGPEWRGNSCRSTLCSDLCGQSESRVKKTKRVSWKTSPDWSPFSRPQERKRRGRWAAAKGGKREKAPDENRLTEAAVSFENPSKSNTKMTIHASVNNIRIAPAVGPNPYIRFNSPRARRGPCLFRLFAMTVRIEKFDKPYCRNFQNRI